MLLKCKECRRTFTKAQIKTSKPVSNISMEPIFLSMQVMNIVSKEIHPVAKFEDMTENQELMNCPHCGYVHLFGFERV